MIPLRRGASACTASPPDELQADTVLFGSRVFYAMEEDGFVDVEVLRIGSVDGPCSVRLSTQDVAGSAKGDKDYVKVKGTTITFDEGERVMRTRILIKDDESWDGLEVIGLVLHDPEGVGLGVVPRALAVVSESDRYPDGLPKSSPPATKWQMVRGFVSERFNNRGWKLVKTVAAMSYQGVHGAIESVILKLVVDLALGGKGCSTGGLTEDDETSAIILGICYLVAFALAHAADRTQLDFRGRSGSRKWFRERLLRKYLLLSDVGIQGFSDGEFLNTMTYRVEEVVTAWYNILLLMQAFIRIAAETAFQLWLIYGKVPAPAILLMVSVLVPAIFGTLWLRETKMLRLIHDRAIAEDTWVTLATNFVMTRELLLSCNAVERSVAQFRRVYDDFYKKHRRSRFYQQASLWMPKWVSAITLAVFYMQSPKLVREHNLSAGDFMAAVKSWMSLRKGIEDAFKAFVIIQRSIIGLEKVCTVFNRDDKVAEVIRNFGKHHQCLSQTKRLTLNGSGFTDLAQLDFMEMCNVSFVYPMSLATTSTGALDYSLFRKHELVDLGEDDDEAMQISDEMSQKRHLTILEDSTTQKEDDVDENGHVKDLTSKADLLANHTWLLKEASFKMSCAQGGLVLFKVGGERGSGRRTVLRILSSMVLPTTGALYMPPHRSWIMVQRFPTFTEDTILRNLRLGRCQAWESGVGKDTSTAKKPIDIPQDAKVPNCSDLLELCRETARVCGLRECFLLDLGRCIGGPGLEILNKHDVVALSLARTFLAEPDVILIDHLGDGLGPAYLQDTMLPLLRKYVQGGLREVLQAPSTCQLPLPPRIKPVVLWSSSILPAHVSLHADMVLTLNDGQLDTQSPHSSWSSPLNTCDHLDLEVTPV